MKLYFARHGDTDANTESLPDPKREVVNEPLNELGMKRARPVGGVLVDR
jgi:broad specificity phosphatase PhoE